MTNNNALVKASSFNLAPISDEITQIINEELDGLGTIPFDNVKIPSGGGLAFEIPGDDPDNPDTVQLLTGVIVHHHAINTYWEQDFDGSNNLPDCSSADGKTGMNIHTGEIQPCASCPYNQFGSAGKGNGKACKNGHRIYLLRENEQLPILLTLPPTSLKAFKDYIAKRLVMKGKRSYEVLTNIKLKKEKNADGIAYSACVFSKADDLSREQVAAVLPTAGWIKSIASNIPLVEEDESEKASENGDFVEVDDEPLPF